MKIGILVGRFQPFHLGHLSAVKYALQQVDLLYIAIGSAQKSHEAKNPFTIGERIRMVKESLDEEGLDCRRWLIIPVSDATAHSLWISYIDMLVPNYNIVFSNDALTKMLFKEKGVEVVEVSLLKRESYSATEVRKRMMNGEDWFSLVPKPVARIIEEVRGVERIIGLKD